MTNKKKSFITEDYKQNLNRRRESWMKKKREKEKLHSYYQFWRRSDARYSAQTAGGCAACWYPPCNSLPFPCEVLIFADLSAAEYQEVSKVSRGVSVALVLLRVALFSSDFTKCWVVFTSIVMVVVWVTASRRRPHNNLGTCGKGRVFLAIIHTHIVDFTYTHAATCVSLAYGYTQR